jgi:hypothetical protein
MDDILEITENQFVIALAIPDEDEVYRQVPLTELDNDGARFPRPDHFTIKYKRGEKDLSVNWSIHTSVEHTYCVIGLTNNYKGEYKDPTKYKLFSIPVAFLRSIKGIEQVLHTPSFNGNPADLGNPNNYSHASIYFPIEEQQEIRKKLSTYCNQNYDASFKQVDYAIICPIIEKLKERKQSTKYHQCMK